MEDTLNGGASFPYCRDHVSEVCRSALSFIFFRINTAACDALIRIYTKCWRGSETRETKTKTLWYKWGDEVKAGARFSWAPQQGPVKSETKYQASRLLV